jgi:hypothetical protein
MLVKATEKGASRRLDRGYVRFKEGLSKEAQGSFLLGKKENQGSN